MSPYATRAAIKVLRKGGNAVDGAVAAAAALGVSEPFVAGPGGGGFFVYYRARDHRVFTIDGREKAPSGAKPELFLDANGEPIDFDQAVESGLSVGVPGNVATWGVALDRFGRKGMRSVLRAGGAARAARLPARPLRSSARSPTTRTSSPASPRARSCSCRAARCRPSSTSCATPTSRAPTPRSATAAGAPSTRARSPARWPPRSALPPTTPGTPPVAGGTMTAADLRAYTAPFRKAAALVLPRLRPGRAWRRRRAAARPSARR